MFEICAFLILLLAVPIPRGAPVALPNFDGCQCSIGQGVSQVGDTFLITAAPDVRGTLSHQPDGTLVATIVSFDGEVSVWHLEKEPEDCRYYEMRWAFINTKTLANGATLTTVFKMWR